MAANRNCFSQASTGRPAHQNGRAAREHIAEFWNRLEAFERRRDAQIAEKFIVALPAELSLEQNVHALQDHIRDFTRQGRVVQVAIHSGEHDPRNMHAHLLVSQRGVDEHGFKAGKAHEQQGRYLNRGAYMNDLRASWQHTCNRHLERHGHEQRIDRRTLADQGIDREPSRHMGPAAAWRERHGLETDRGFVNRAREARNAERPVGSGTPTETTYGPTVHKSRYLTKNGAGCGEWWPRPWSSRPISPTRARSLLPTPARRSRSTPRSTARRNTPLSGRARI